MSEDNSAYTVTLKGGKGYEDSWIVVRGDSKEELTDRLYGIGDLVAATTAAASLFQGASNAQPIVAPAAAPAAPVQQQAAPGWSTAPAQQAAPQQQFVPQGAATGPRGERLHPEGKTCAICPNVLMEKKTQNGKLKWQCQEWRWNNGNPNQHTAEFQN